MAIKLKGLDYLNIASEFSDDEILVQHTARNFVENEILQIIEKHFEEGTFPIHLVQQFADLGFLGVNIPEEFGGAGLSNLAYGLVCQELEKGDSGIRSFVSVQGSLVMYPIFKYGNKNQKEKWIPLLANSKIIGCFGLTEPDFGSNPAGLTTRAQKVSGGYILNGTKMWITNGSIADIAIVWAKTDDDVIRGFIVEKEFEGFSAPEMKNKWSLRASVTSELVLDNVFVPEENLLPNIEGVKGPLGCLSQARFGIAFGSIGSAMAVYEASLKYARERIQFDKPIASFQLVQEKLVWMLNEITKGQLLALQVGKNKDNGTATFQQISMAKRNNVWVARECAKLAREIHGANGISSEYPIMRHLMNIESVYTYEGTHDMHTLILGQDVTGIQAFSDN
ncbi:MAG: acyl-CoA dehydrogenase family protein [Candidatus Marinimicrobia bacterium]|nr:acyl-CoA dehydrogenase family protein [Candidatus Neomarinimicrobiota bacterium]MBL7022829.1 acyl-CoA dehydrogenase family protein [Candidatus Neomarinimicrobiota bacterium]MBL7109450.1 acyl-CoA dehydrogenase family protein [Candidatus Neomarinimicrobiota bacterium]